LRNADFGLRIKKDARALLLNPKSAFRIPKYVETPKRGQGAQCPDRFKMNAVDILTQIFRE
jgi:hypothetical protein